MVVERFNQEDTSKPRNRRSNNKDVQWHEFLSLDSAHPYGCLPAGNRLLLEDNDTMINPNLDPNGSCLTRHLNEETWLSILGFCDGVSLARMVQTCRLFYVVGHQPELWRDLVLRRLHRKKSVIDVMGNSWKDTYVLQFLGKKQLDCPSKPMKMPGIYSDELYRLHSVRAFFIPECWLQPPNNPHDSNNKQSKRNKCLVEHVKAEDMTCDRFVTKYEKPNTPVLIQGAAKTWKAVQDWQDPSYLRQHTKERTFRATSGVAPLPANFTMEAFQTYISNPQLEEAPLYLFDREALQPNSHLHQDFFPDLQRSCPYFDPHRVLNNDNDQVGHDLFQVLGEGKRPDHTWAIVGGSHSGSVMHIDPNATHAWNAAIVGRKRWIFYPPGITPPGVHPSQDGDEVALPLSIGEWILTFWKEHQERKANAPPQERPLECTAFPGDVVFVPHGWWHMVINLDTVNIAITHNYVSRSNLGNLLRFLKLKEDQISGCRDRTNSIKPEQLHSAFITALQKQFGKESDWLVQAQQQTQWTCNAWSDECNGDESEHQSRLSKKRRTGDTSSSAGDDSENCKRISIMEKAKGSSDAPPAFSFSFL